jgi:hypothetical protein
MDWWARNKGSRDNPECKGLYCSQGMTWAQSTAR